MIEKRRITVSFTQMQYGYLVGQARRLDVSIAQVLRWIIQAKKTKKDDIKVDTGGEE